MKKLFNSGKSIRWILFLAGYFLIFPVLSQETVTDSSLLITSRTKARVYQLNKGKRIVYKLKGDPKKHYGWLSSFTETGFCLKDTCIELSDLTMIGKSSVGMIIAKSGGALVTLAGAGITGTGVYIFYNLFEDPSSGKAGGLGVIVDIIVFVAGAIVTVAGVIIAMVGAIPLVINQSRYDLVEKYDIKTNQKLTKKELKEYKKQFKTKQ